MPSFTVTIPRKNITQLITKCGVVPTGQRFNNAPTEYIAVWDTGSTSSVISTKMAKDLNLPIIGFTKTQTGNGIADAELFYVDIMLPCQLILPKVKVSALNLFSIDMLIGMDIISHGDFALSTYGNQALFSFRIPAKKECRTDFVKIDTGKQEPIRNPSEPARNAPCPCGSGKKYKLCCGKKTF